tara:strand:- start:174 stop:344 length:171 start_codon:yes stop_codon:yes gene_type:complete
MAMTIKFEDDDGKVYKTPVIEDTDDVYRRPSVIHGDEDPDGLPLTKKKKKSKKRYT